MKLEKNWKNSHLFCTFDPPASAYHLIRGCYLMMDYLLEKLESI